jgi:hypothetical protein
MLDMNNILLAGIPRSGTTLVCILLNKLQNVAALPEPIDVGIFAGGSSVEDWYVSLDNFILQTRKNIMLKGFALAKVGPSNNESNYFKSISSDILRQDEGKKSILSFNISSDQFTLLIKHPNAFTAMLPQLSKRYKVAALIRNPLAILASWNTINANFRFGHAPIAEEISPQLKVRLASFANDLDRQLSLLSWYFEQYQEFVKPDMIIRYETIIQSGGKNLSPLFMDSFRLNEQLTNCNFNSDYAKIDLETIAERLLSSSGKYWLFYSRDDVLALLRGFTATR